MTLSGTLAIADISGYTKYMSDVELEHSTDILADLIGVVVAAMGGRFELAKLEGDAVFLHAPDDAAEGIAYIAAVESCYFAFAERLWNIANATTCGCRACARLPDLDLKFVVHHGEYVVHEVATLKELVGEEIIRVHRLLKNSVRESTGIQGYAMFTRAFIDRFDIDTSAFTPHREETDDCGVVDGFVLDLKGRWETDRERRAIRVTAGDGVDELPMEVNVPLAVAWDYTTSPTKQLLWLADEERHETPDGIPGVGMRTHCVHGDMTLVRDVVDWKPFRYITYRIATPAGPFIATEEYEAVAGGARTKITLLARPDGGPDQAPLLAQHRDALATEILRARIRLSELLSTGVPGDAKVPEPT